MLVTWATVHAGVESPQAREIIEEIACAASPEEAARIGRRNERLQPSLVRPDWPTAKLAVMHAGLIAKVSMFLGLELSSSLCIALRHIILQEVQSGLVGDHQIHGLAVSGLAVIICYCFERE